GGPAGRSSGVEGAGVGTSRRTGRSRAPFARSRRAGVAAIAPEGNARAGEAHACRASGGPAQLARVAPGGAVAGVRSQHAHELGDDLALLELHDARPREIGGGVLDDREV